MKIEQAKKIKASVTRRLWSKRVHQADSLDLNPSSYAATGFPDTDRRVLYSGIDTLWAFVDRSFNDADNKHKEFSKDKLRQVSTDAGFSFDSSGNQQFETKREFNRRYAVDWLTNEADTVTMQVRFWFGGKKYILINQRWDVKN
ncbi:MAG TPA: hypothetical protein VFR58_10975 [Flavisolibacter sp.]|nr:hypothetical protein [Flavisolibacter sp.]